MRSQASYRIFGDAAALTAARVSAALGLEPTRAVEAGQVVGRSSPRAAPVSAWHLDSAPEPQSGAELSEHLHRLLDQLQHRAGALWELKEAGYHIDWFCYLGSYATEHAAEFDHDLMRRLLTVPGPLLLDIYDDEPDED